MSKVRSIHFVGIKGVGLTPLALIAKEAGIEVTGSDINEEFITDSALKKVGITPLVGFDPVHVQNVDIVITTGAHGGYQNPEVVEAKRKGIPVLTRAEAVGEFMKGTLFGRSFRGISVAGTHGKTTTTAMVITILKQAGIDPSYLVGTSDIGGVDLPGHFGKGNYFVAEADEYATEPQSDHKAAFLWHYPDIALFTNIEHDHPDIYPDIQSVEEVFSQFTEQVNDTIIGCGDDERVYSILKNSSKRTITYGFSPKNDYVLERVSVSGDQTFFHVSSMGVDLGEFRMRVMGDHNALNALGALIVCLEVGVSLEKIRDGLSTFRGTKRRQEFKGKMKNGADVYDDYAHHPTEIKKTLHALRQRYTKEEIVCVFQPHTFTRTKALYQEFIHAFDDASRLILTDIYGSLREERDESISSQRLADDIARVKKNVQYVPLTEVASVINNSKLDHTTVVIFMGAGDVYKEIEHLEMRERKE